LIAAQDHKRAYDGDKGPNTGGMGAYSPAPVFTHDVYEDVMKNIIQPTVDGMAKDGHPFVGVLFAGLMITKDGPKLIEYNARFGDPECQVIMRRLESDLMEIFIAAEAGKLKKLKTPKWSDKSVANIVMAAPNARKRASFYLMADGCLMSQRKEKPSLMPSIKPMLLLKRLTGKTAFTALILAIMHSRGTEYYR